MKKKLSLITLLALSVQGLFAQGLLSHLNDTTNKRSLFERVTNIEKKNNLMYIQKGTTVINIKVPYVWQGAIVSIAGIILSVVWVIALGKTGKSGKNKNENI